MHIKKPSQFDPKKIIGLDSGEDIIKKIPLKGPISDLLEKFVEQHFKPEEFIKRKRDRARIDENVIRGGDQRLKRKNSNFH